MKRMIRLFVLLTLISTSQSLFAYRASDTINSLMSHTMYILFSPFALTTSVINGDHLGDMRVVKDDAIRSLAGEERTDRLTSLIEFLREDIEELVNYSDEEIEFAIIQEIDKIAAESVE